MPTAAVSFYSFVLFVHIAAAIAAFGPAFAYPLLSTMARRGDPRLLAPFHRAQERIGSVLVTPAAALVLVAGLYLTIAGPFGFDEPFVGAGILIILIILGLLGAFFAPQERRLAALAEQDAAGPGATGAEPAGEDYTRAAQRVVAVRAGAIALVLLAVFLMVTKPGS